MLWNELEAAYAQVDTTGKLAELQCSASVQQAIQTVYTSRKGETLFSGLDRHRKCALWVRDNQPTVARLARMIARQERIARWQEFRDCAERLCRDVLNGQISEYTAAQTLRLATNLNLGEF